MRTTIEAGWAWRLAVALGLAACGSDGAASPDLPTDSAVDAADTADTGIADGTAEDSGIVETADAADDVGPALPGADLAWPGWDASTIYFIITDRFLDGDPSNDRSYGRRPDGKGEVATFHGGDLAGIRKKLDEGYFLALGVGALWITAPYEQVHGWVSSGNLEHWAYHGYFALDFTKIDANMGSEDDLRALVDSAHAQGIRVVLDVVMNHAGYATTADLSAYGIDVLKPGWENATPATLYDYIDFQDPDFADWWGPKWIRAEIGGGYPAPDNSDLKKTVDYLPDFLTESTATDIGLPVFYAHKPDTNAVERPDNTVREYLIEWLTRWVRDFGIDGFRCDTAKHVEKDAWKALKIAGDAALVAWRGAHADVAFPASDYRDASHPFWMTGEVFPHGVVKDDYFQNGFDSLINFDYQAAAGAALEHVATIDATWSDMAARLGPDPDFDVLSYLSSHDTSLFFEQYARKDVAKQALAGTLLLMTPGAAQIFYGDENGRGYGTVADASHRTRTDYAWGANPGLLAHWQKVGRFRKKHPAIGAGTHTKIADEPYTFVRQKGDDVVWVVIGASAPVTIAVGDGADGVTLRDAYTGKTATVAGGLATFTPDPSGLVLVERAAP